MANAIDIRDEVYTYLAGLNPTGPTAKPVAYFKTVVPVIEMEDEEDVRVDVFPLTRSATRFDRGVWRRGYVIRIVIRCQNREASDVLRTSLDEQFVAFAETIDKSLENLRSQLFAVGSIEQKDDIAREQRVENNLLVSVSDVECVVIE